MAHIGTLSFRVGFTDLCWSKLVPSQLQAYSAVLLRLHNKSMIEAINLTLERIS
jgi:hypothetical protein